MGIEIERKFLVHGTNYRATGKPTLYRQGYLSTDPERTVRVRIAGDQAMITIKGRTQGIARSEFEYGIPTADAAALLDLCLRPLIEKTRYELTFGSQVWIVDEFANENAGLVLAEIELPAVDHPFVKPDWCGAEVSDDHRYFNSYLVAHPFTTW